MAEKSTRFAARRDAQKPPPGDRTTGPVSHSRAARNRTIRDTIRPPHAGLSAPARPGGPVSSRVCDPALPHAILSRVVLWGKGDLSGRHEANSWEKPMRMGMDFRNGFRQNADGSWDAGETPTAAPHTPGCAGPVIKTFNGPLRTRVVSNRITMAIDEPLRKFSL